jgi:hypothetical protein
MKLMRIVLCSSAVIACAGSVAAQTKETESKTKITVKDGESLTVTGCVAPAGDGGFTLTNVADKRGNLHDYILVPSDNDDVSKHIGHRVQISGKATDRGDGKVEIEDRAKTKAENGKDQKTRSKSQIEGGTAPYLSVKSLKMIAATCP